MRSSLIPDKFAQWNVGRFALSGRARLTIKKNEAKQFLSNRAFYNLCIDI